MHLLGEDASTTHTYDRIVRVRHRHGWRDRLRALAVLVLARHFNYRGRAGRQWRVDLAGLHTGGARLVLSVLYVPWAEIDLDKPALANPEAGYFGELIDHLEAVERDLEEGPHAGLQQVVGSAVELDAAVAADRVAVVHCVEGGFHLGATPEAVADNVAELARRGVGYVTLAHLFYRGVATNAPALPMFSDAWYDRLFGQPDRGLTALGRAAVTAMYEQRILIDVSHMRAGALTETFALLDELDARNGTNPREYPVIASHAGYRFGDQSYMLDEPTIRAIAARDGVIGLILARHQLQGGLSDGEGIDHTVAIMRRHVDRIAEITGSHAHTGLGSDLDGFIKPTMGGIETAVDLARLEDGIREAYPTDADAILFDNARRVVTRVLAQRVA